MPLHRKVNLTKRRARKMPKSLPSYFLISTIVHSEPWESVCAGKLKPLLHIIFKELSLSKHFKKCS